MSTILVTGGAGFIGAHVARSLLARGDDVVVLDDFNTRYDPRLKEERVAHLLADLPAENLVRGSICDVELVGALVAQRHFDTIIHLAAWASVQPSIANPYVYTMANVDGTVVMLEAARRYGVQNFVFASSSSVYGGRTDGPFREVDDVSRPISPYAATKVAGEVFAATWHALYGLPVSCLRFFTVYGPWGRPEMALFRFAQAIRAGEPLEMRGRETRRDFTYIDDIVRGVIAAADTPHGFRIYNLGNHDAVPLPRFIAALEAALGTSAQVHEVPLPLGDVPLTLADISRAQAELGYAPETGVETGVAQFAEWYDSWYAPWLAELPPV